MKNKEKYIKEMVDIAISGNGIIALNRATGEPDSCSKLGCENCSFSHGNCTEQLNKWAESEYEKPLSAKTVTDDFQKFCRGKDCSDCEFSNTSLVTDCRIRYVFENYNVTVMKEKKK